MKNTEIDFNVGAIVKIYNIQWDGTLFVEVLEHSRKVGKEAAEHPWVKVLYDSNNKFEVNSEMFVNMNHLLSDRVILSNANRTEVILFGDKTYKEVKV
jgi:hypothetical protein